MKSHDFLYIVLFLAIFALSCSSGGSTQSPSGDTDATEADAMDESENETEIEEESAHGLLVPSPEEIRFGAVILGNSGTETLTLTNDGEESLTISVVRTSEATTPEFSVQAILDGDQPVDVPVVLVPDQRITLSLQYMPVDAGSDTGTLEIIGENFQGNLLEISLFADEKGESALDAPPRLEFGYAGNVGEEESRVLTIWNLPEDPESNRTLQITKLELTQGSRDYRLDVDTCTASVLHPILIAPGRSHACQVVFSPREAGELTGILHVETDASEGETQRNVDLEGRCAPPETVLAVVVDPRGEPVPGAKLGLWGEDTILSITDSRGRALILPEDGGQIFAADGAKSIRGEYSRQYKKVLPEDEVTVFVLEMLPVEASQPVSLKQLSAANLEGARLAFSVDDVQFPDGAGTELFMGEGHVSAAPYDLPEGKELVQMFHFGPDGTTFTNPARLTLPNTLELAPGERIEFHSFDESTLLWEKAAVLEVNAEGTLLETVEGGISHFSAGGMFQPEGSLPEYTVTGLVQDDLGQLLDDITVHAVGVRGRMQDDDTDTQGRYTISGVRVACRHSPYLTVAASRSGTFMDDTLTSVVAEVSDDPGEVVQAPVLILPNDVAKGSVRGVALSPLGAPVEAARVSVHPALGWDLIGQTDAEGNFLEAAVPAGAARVEIAHDELGLYKEVSGTIPENGEWNLGEVILDEIADTTPPSVLWTMPVDGQENLYDLSELRVVFNETLDPATLQVTLKRMLTDRSVIGSVTLENGTAVVFTPEAGFEDGRAYTFTLGAGLADLSGNVLGEEYVLQFQTVAPTCADAECRSGIYVWATESCGLGVVENGTSCDAGSGPGSGECLEGVCQEIVSDGDEETDDADWEEEEEVNSTPGFVPITAGTFWMGSPDGDCPAGYPGECIDEPGRDDSDEKLHEVTLTYDFEMQAHEVTQEEWFAAFGNNPSYFGPNGDGADCGDNCPVELANWYEVLEYANWLSTENGLAPCYTLTNCSGTIGGGCAPSEHFCSSETYSCTVSLNGVSKPQECEGFRLPTEAEWEYAIRAGSNTAFYPSDGNDGTITELECGDPNLDQIAWYGYFCDSSRPYGQSPVSSKEPNAWGLYDMSGNLWEWVWDLFQGQYENDVAIDPTGPSSGGKRVRRSGSWAYHAKNSRSAARYQCSPGDRDYGISFRLARSLPPDPCAPDPCNEHGTCAIEDGDAACTCHEGFGGDWCDECTEGYEGYPDCEEIIPEPEFVAIEAGTFWMGSPDGDCPAGYPGECITEMGRTTANEELHEVALTYDFELNAFEITQGQFRERMQWNPSYFGPNGEGLDCGNSCPVEMVSWYDALAYANELSLNAGLTPCYVLENVRCVNDANVGAEYLDCFGGDTPDRGIDSASVTLAEGASKPQECEGFRLPTEAEWEYAIRTGDQFTAFYQSEGNDGKITNLGCNDPNLSRIAWYCGNNGSAGTPTYGPKPVGGKDPNDWGLYDMSGNVYEWVWDWYRADYQNDAAVDPVGPESGAERGGRGGRWSNISGYCRSAYRLKNEPEYRDDHIGFRLARTRFPDTCTPDPCHGHGACAIEDGDVACSCHEGFGGDWCDRCAEGYEGYPDCIPEAVDGDEEVDDAEWEEEADEEEDVEVEPTPGFIFVEAGTFWMGAPSEGDCPEEYPGECTEEFSQGMEKLHEVTLTYDFELQAHELTQGEWSALMDWNPSTFNTCDGGDGSTCPVESISWYDAVAYANEMSTAAGLTPCYVITDVECEDFTSQGSNYMACINTTRRGIDGATVALADGLGKPQECEGYRLPTEAEWEYSIRTGDTYTAFYSGVITSPMSGYDPSLSSIGWYDYNSDSGSGKMSHPVGLRVPNDWGFYDMSGNLYEWCWDWFQQEYDVENPIDPVGPSTGSNRAARGGSLRSVARYCRSGSRGSDSPSMRRDSSGLRLARSLHPNSCASDTCNSHGTCDDTNGYALCDCNTGYDGADCSVCAEGYEGYPDCRDDPCQPDPCNDHGTCNSTDGSCTCDNAFMTEDCGACLDGYEGYPDCEPEAVDGDEDEDEELSDETEEDVEIEPTPDFVPITAGTFWMGSPDGDCPAGYPGNCIDEPGRYSYEELHEVTLTYDFELQAYEVTEVDFETVMSWNPVDTHDSDCTYGCGDDHPVKYVSWYDVLAYANELSLDSGLTPCYVFSSVTCEEGGSVGADYMQCMNPTQQGIDSATVTLSGGASKPQDCEGYRLPTEAEWEYAIRSGSEYTAFYQSDGNDGTITYTDCTLDNNLDQIAVYCANDPGGTAPVGTKEANAWGLYDMSGNVWEWVWDWYQGDYETDVGTDPVGPSTGSRRVLRGGNWSNGARGCRSAYRFNGTPGYRYAYVGLRLCRSSP